MLAWCAENQGIKRVLFFIQLDVADRTGDTCDKERGFFRQIIPAAKDNAIAKALAFPEGRPGASAFHAGEILF